jgi:hypothetical protein
VFGLDAGKHKNKKLLANCSSEILSLISSIKETGSKNIHESLFFL